MSAERTLVIGGGIIGTFAGNVLQDRDIPVDRIVEATDPQKNPSYLAGAVSKPYADGETPPYALKWLFQNSIAEWNRIISLYGEAKSGVRKDQVWNVSEEENIDTDKMAWLVGIPGGYEIVTDPARIPGNYNSAVVFESVYIDPTICYPWLREQFVKRGGRFERIPKIKDLGEFIEKAPEEKVVHATGLGARKLLNDENIHPVRGQIILARADPAREHIPNGTDTIYGDRDYVFVRGNSLILGGTVEPDKWLTVTTKEGKKSILDHAVSVLPNLNPQTDIEAIWACLRPVREGGLRISRRIVNGKTVVDIVGLGGSGYTNGPAAVYAGLKLLYPIHFEDIEPPFDELNAA